METPGDEVRQLFIDPDWRGIQLVDYLERRWPGADRRFLRRLIRSGDVTVNRDVVHPQRRLSASDVIEVGIQDDEVPRRPAGEPGEEQPLAVLHEDDRLIVADKPAGMHSVPDRGGKYLGVYGRLGELRPGEDLRIVHRLDLETSGCLVLAKGLEAARALDRAFRAGAVHKEYLALVDGVVSRRELSIRRSLGPDRRRPGKVRVVEPGSKGARDARTDVVVEEQFRSHALVRVFPRTGRSHQIRVHLSSAGYPIVGDRNYGSGRELLLSRIKPGYKLRRGVRERPLLRRTFLHAEVIEIPSLAAGGGDEPVRVRAPLPRDLDVALGKLRRFSTGANTACD